MQLDEPSAKNLLKEKTKIYEAAKVSLGKISDGCGRGVEKPDTLVLESELDKLESLLTQFADGLCAKKAAPLATL